MEKKVNKKLLGIGLVLILILLVVILVLFGIQLSGRKKMKDYNNIVVQAQKEDKTDLYYYNISKNSKKEKPGVDLENASYVTQHIVVGYLKAREGTMNFDGIVTYDTESQEQVDLVSLEDIQELEGTKDGEFSGSIIMTKDQKFVFFKYGDYLFRYNVELDKLILMTIAETSDIDVSEDGRFFYFLNNGFIYQQDLTKLQDKDVYNPPSTPAPEVIMTEIAAFDISGDGHYLVYQKEDDPAIYFHDLFATETKVLVIPDKETSSFCISDDGDYVIYTDTKKSKEVVYLIDIENERARELFKGKSGQQLEINWR